MTKLSKHFSLEEMTKTSVQGVKNIPNDAQISNLNRLCGWLDKLRDEYKNDIEIHIGWEMEYYPLHFEQMLKNAVSVSGTCCT